MSASARTGRCKKIAVSQRVFSNFPVPYVSRYSQFSCGFRRASEGVPPSDTAPLNSFLPPGASPPGNPSGEAGGRINSPTNPNLNTYRSPIVGIKNTDVAQKGRLWLTSSLASVYGLIVSSPSNHLGKQETENSSNTIDPCSNYIPFARICQ